MGKHRDDDGARLRLEVLTPATLDVFGGLLGGAGFGGCFCAVWTSFDGSWSARCGDPARPNLAITRRDVDAGRRAGYLVYMGDSDALVAWTGSGPKTAFPLLATKLGSRLTPSGPRTWAIGCLAVGAGWRGRGLAARVVEAVLAEACGAGADVVEAYPTRPWDEPRSYRGALSMYARLGFEEVGAERDGESEIVLVRKVLG